MVSSTSPPSTPTRNLQATKVSRSAWASNGGIVGRGILLDYQTWASKNSITLAPLSSSSFPFSHLRRLIADYHIEIRHGDILFIRSGFTAAYNALSPTEQQALSQRSTNDFMGIESTEEVLVWLWENQFAAVAGDSPSFESSPVGAGKVQSGVPFVVLHQWLLAGWGMPIGEMFDLEELARHCGECGRWSFFLSSVPLKVSINPDCHYRAINRRELIGILGPWWRGKSCERCRYLLAKGKGVPLLILLFHRLSGVYSRTCHLPALVLN